MSGGPASQCGMSSRRAMTFTHNVYRLVDRSLTDIHWRWKGYSATIAVVMASAVGPDDLLCVDLSGRRCTDLAELNAGDAARATFAFLQQNHLSLWTDFIHFRSPLRILDLRHNLFISLPAGAFWNNLPNLQVLYLDSNAITSVASLASLSPLQNLLAVSFARNPVAVKTGYRQELITTLPKLIMIDEYIVSDQERLRQRNLGSRMIPATNRFHFPMFAMTSCDRPEVCLASLDAYLQRLRSVEERLSPVRTMQRWWRTLKQRQRLLEEEMARMSGRLQRQKSLLDTKRRLSRQAASTDSATLTRLNSIIDDDDSDNESDEDSPVLRSGDLEYDLRTVRRRAEIQQEFNTIVLIGGDRSGVFSRLVHQARATTLSTHVSDDDLAIFPVNIFVVPPSRYSIGNRSRTLSQAVTNSKAFQPHEPDLIIRRRLCHPCRKWRESFHRGWSEDKVPDEDRHVYCFKAPNSQFRESLLRLVACHNLEASKHGHNPIDVVLYRHVLESLSACRIQCWWRGWCERRQLASALHAARRIRRAAICLVHAWQNYLMRLRFRMLHESWNVCSAIQSPYVFLSRRALDLLTVPNPFRSLQLFPEHRIQFCVERGDVIFQSEEDHMRPVPKWLGIGDFSAETVADEFSDGQLCSGLRDLTQCHTSSELKVVSRGQQSDPEALWLIEFPSVAQAQLRAFLLLIHTWEPITMTFCHARPAECNRSGRWSAVGCEVQPPDEYRDLPSPASAADDGHNAFSPINIVYRSRLNPEGNLIHDSDRELVGVDPEIAGHHGISDTQLKKIVQQSIELDDNIESTAFLFADSFCEGDSDLEARMQWQTANLQLEAFCPNLESNQDRADVGLRTKLTLAEFVRQESEHLSTACQTEHEQELGRKKQIAQTQRDLHHIRSNMNKIQTRKLDDHCPEIPSQSRQQAEHLRLMVHRARMRKRQFQKDQMIERRISQVQRQTDRVNEVQELAEAKAAAEGANRARVDELHSVAQTAQAIRANRNRIMRDGLHFQRQLCQISKQIRSAQAQEAASLRSALTARDVQVRKVRDARLRQTVHDRLLSEFNRKRQNAIVHQLQIRDHTEQKRNQEHQTLSKARAERRQMRQIREQIAEEVATCRDIMHFDDTANDYDVIAPFVTGPMDDNLTDKLHELEELANSVRRACSQVFNSA